jgi:uncharacterized RDD family membrane protein YckC
MKTVNIPTFLNIDLSFEMAAVGRRFGAYFIDWGIKIIYIVIIFSTLEVGMVKGSTLYSFIIYSPFYFYSFILEWLNKGQTIGKMLVGIKVIGLDGNSPTVSQCAIRWMFLFVDSYMFALLVFMNPMFGFFVIMSPLVGCLFIVLTKQNQRIGDIAAQTYIVQAKETEVSIYDTIFSYAVSKKKNYNVLYPEIIKFTDKDMTIVKNLFEKSEMYYNYELAHKVANHIKKMLEIESKESDDVFLKKLLEDYNYLSLQKG